MAICKFYMIRIKIIRQRILNYILYYFLSGLNGYNFDPSSLAMDYRSVGFRECASEVARYLVSVEGMDIQDPLRLRLMGHLQGFPALSRGDMKPALPPPPPPPPPPPQTAGTWGSAFSTHSTLSHGQYPTSSLPPFPPPPPTLLPQHPTQSDQLNLSGIPTMPCTDSSRLPHAQLPEASTRLSGGIGSPNTSLHSQFPSMHSQFPSTYGMTSMTSLSSSGLPYNSNTVSSIGQSLGQSSKSYTQLRPFGAELAY